jgi:hypothetical protein
MTNRSTTPTGRPAVPSPLKDSHSNQLVDLTVPPTDPPSLLPYERSNNRSTRPLPLDNPANQLVEVPAGRPVRPSRMGEQPVDHRPVGRPSFSKVTLTNRSDHTDWPASRPFSLLRTGEQPVD